MELSLILPYVNFLKEKINQFRRIERRKEQIELCYPGEIGGGHNNLFTKDFQIPVDPYLNGLTEQQAHSIHEEEIVVFREKAFTEAERLEKVRKELELIKYGAGFDSDGNLL